jgi:hypothetical protein
MVGPRDLNRLHLLIPLLLLSTRLGYESARLTYSPTFTPRLTSPERRTTAPLLALRTPVELSSSPGIAETFKLCHAYNQQKHEKVYRAADSLQGLFLEESEDSEVLNEVEGRGSAVAGQSYR